jgi:hypothetical protein
LLQLVDRLYELWEQRRVTVSDSAVARPDWLTQLRGVADLTTLRDQLIVIVQDNMKTLIGVRHRPSISAFTLAILRLANPCGRSWR